MVTFQHTKLDFSDAGKSVRTLSVVYASRQKQQMCNFTKISAGVNGTIKVKELDPSFNNECYLVKFVLDGQTYYCRLARTMIEFL